MSRKSWASWVALSLVAGLSSSGCKHDRDKAVAASYSSATHGTPVVAAPLSAVGVASIPVEEEYEERSEAAITASNLNARIAEVETEIGH